MPFDVNEWANDLGLTGDERASAIAIFGKPDRLEKLEKNQLRQTDFSRQMDKLKADQTKIEADRTKADEDIAAERHTLVTWRTNAEGQLTAAQKAREDADRRAFELDQKLRKLAEDNGLDITDLKLETKVPEKKTDERPIFDADGFRKEVGTSLVGSYRLGAMLIKLNAEHKKLFGEDIPEPEKLVDLVLEAHAKGREVTLNGVWEEQYKVADKRKTLGEADIARRIAEGVEAGVRTRLEAAELGQKGPDDLPGSPILARFGKKPADQNKNDNPRHNGETAAEIATRAFRSGKYRKEAQVAARAAMAG